MTVHVIPDLPGYAIEQKSSSEKSTKFGHYWVVILPDGSVLRHTHNDQPMRFYRAQMAINAALRHHKDNQE